MITTSKFEHTSLVLHVEEKNFTLTSKEILQGLTQESTRLLTAHGEEGWELVSVSWHVVWSIAYLKRPKE